MIKKRILFTVIMIILSLFAFIGCASQSFNSAKKINTIDAYDSFLKEYPRHELANEARKLRMLVSFDNAKKINTIDAYDSFLNEYFYIKLTTESRNQVKKAVKKKNTTVNAYNSSFKKEDPDHELASEARKLRESLICEEIKSKNTVEAYLSYYKKYPDIKCSPVPEEVQLVIQLSSSDETVHVNTYQKLVAIGEKISEPIVDYITNIMRTGKKRWSKNLYRQSHCTWYEDTTEKYYAANALINIKSPYITQDIVSEAKLIKNNAKTKHKVTDPGWV